MLLILVVYSLNVLSLKEIDLSFKTYNIKDIRFMLYGWSSLKKVNLSNLKTNIVKDKWLVYLMHANH